jgi:hypothetical protein
MICENFIDALCALVEKKIKQSSYIHFQYTYTNLQNNINTNVMTSDSFEIIGFCGQDISTIKSINIWASSTKIYSLSGLNHLIGKNEYKDGLKIYHFPSDMIITIPNLAIPFESMFVEIVSDEKEKCIVIIKQNIFID